MNPCLCQFGRIPVKSIGSLLPQFPHYCNPDHFRVVDRDHEIKKFTELNHAGKFQKDKEKELSETPLGNGRTTIIAQSDRRVGATVVVSSKSC